MGLKLVTAPANDPLTLAQAKAHLKVEHSDDDALIAAMLSASVQHVDGPRGLPRPRADRPDLGPLSRQLPAQPNPSSAPAHHHRTAADRSKSHSRR
jgi:hypothetical protein